MPTTASADRQQYDDAQNERLMAAESRCTHNGGGDERRGKKSRGDFDDVNHTYVYDIQAGLWW